MKPLASITVPVLAFVSWTSAAQQASQPASQPTAFDLRLTGAVRTVLVEVQRTVKGKVTIKRGADTMTTEVDHKSRARWVDECDDLGTDPVEDKRTFLEAQVTENGVPDDPGLEGVTVVLTTSEGRVRGTTQPPRRVLNDTLRAQLSQAGATGLFLELPEDARLGASFKYDGKPLLNTLLDTDGEVNDITGDLTLDSVDAAGTKAFLSGSLAFTDEVEEGGVKFEARYRGGIKIELDLAKDEVTEVSLVATAKVSGLGEFSGSLEGEVAFDARATAKTTKDAAALKGRKPVFRDNWHRVSGIEFKLPSCWVDASDKSGTTKFIDSRIEQNVVIEIVAVDEEADPGSDAFVKGFTESLRKTDPKAKVQKASFGSFKGTSFEATDPQGIAIRGAITPSGDGRLRIRLMGAPDVVRKAESEFKAMLSSLKKQKG